MDDVPSGTLSGGNAMRARLLTICMICWLVATGCQLGRKSPYADDPLLLYYKPTLNDSATILAERTARREPVNPPSPSIAQNASQLPAVGSITTVSNDPNVQPAAATKLAPLAPNAEIRPLPRESLISALPPETEQSKVTTDTGARMPTPNIKPLPLSPSSQVQPVGEVRPLADVKPVSVEVGPMNPEPQKPLPVEHKVVPGRFGHDANYHWIQGTLEKHYRGYYCLRYRDPSEDDTYGGKVRVIDDPRLLQFQDGDVLGLEGDLLPDNGAQGHWDNPQF